MTTVTKLPRPKGLNGRPLTESRLNAMVEEIVKEHPRRINPVVKGSAPNDCQCVYQDGDRRCIIGEVLHRLGADVSKLPQSESIYALTRRNLFTGNSVDIRHWFTNGAANRAHVIQEAFDVGRPRWGSAWKAMNSDF